MEIGTVSSSASSSSLILKYIFIVIVVVVTPSVYLILYREQVSTGRDFNLKIQPRKLEGNRAEGKGKGYAVAAVEVHIQVNSSLPKASQKDVS